MVVGSGESLKLPNNTVLPVATSTILYQSCEEIKRGDRVLFHGDLGEIEFVADALIGDPATDWCVGATEVRSDHPRAASPARSRKC